jgi:Family of unknown function (DUF716)
LAFLVEGLLLVFHLKGSPLEILLHKILVITIFITVLVMFLEIVYPRSVLLAVARSQLVLLQGVWWLQMARMMYRSTYLFTALEHQ